MDVIQYIAANNPDGATELCNNYGFQCNSYDDACNGLHYIATEGGDQGLRDVMNVHPERDVILALFSSKKSRDCKLDGMMQPTNQASGGMSMTPNAAPAAPAFGGTSAVMVVGIVALIGIAIIISKD